MASVSAWLLLRFRDCHRCLVHRTNLVVSPARTIEVRHWRRFRPRRHCATRQICAWFPGEVSTQFGKAESAAYLAREIQAGNVIYMPEREIGRLQDLLSKHQLLLQKGRSPSPTNLVSTFDRALTIVSGEALVNSSSIQKTPGNGRDWIERTPMVARQGELPVRLHMPLLRSPATAVERGYQRIPPSCQAGYSTKANHCPDQNRLICVIRQKCALSLHSAIRAPRGNVAD